MSRCLTISQIHPIEAAVFVTARCSFAVLESFIDYKTGLHTVNARNDDIAALVILGEETRFRAPARAIETVEAAHQGHSLVHPQLRRGKELPSDIRLLYRIGIIDGNGESFASQRKETCVDAGKAGEHPASVASGSHQGNADGVNRIEEVSRGEMHPLKSIMAGSFVA